MRREEHIGWRDPQEYQPERQEAAEANDWQYETSEPVSTKPSVAEILTPSKLEGLGYGIYTSFENNALDKDVKNTFMNGEVRNPVLEYPGLSSEGASKLQRMHDELGDALDQAVEASDVFAEPARREAVESTVGYQQRALEYGLVLAEINELSNKLRIGELDDEGKAELREKLELSRQMNQELYGRLDEKDGNAILRTIWNRVGGRLAPGGDLEHDERAKMLYEELGHGFTAPGGHEVAGLPQEFEVEGEPVSPQELPKLNEGEPGRVLDWAGKHFNARYGWMRQAIEAKWQDKQEVHGEEYTAGPVEIVEFFEDIINRDDPNREHGVQVEVKPGANALSWNSNVRAVRVGENRTPFKKPEALYQKVLHEYAVHGGRSLNGFETGLPIMGTGVYTKDDEGKWSSYGVFEEGFATLVEASVADKKPGWTVVNLAKPLGIALAEQGYDFRSVYELTWRYAALMNAKKAKGEDQATISDELIEKSQDTAYRQALRIFRGNQLDLAEHGIDNVPITYNKDLNYFTGRMKAMDYMVELYEQGDTDGLDGLLEAKIDPTVPEQADLVRRIEEQKKARYRISDAVAKAAVRETAYIKAVHSK